MTADDILRRALELPEKERAHLAARLLASLDAEIPEEEAEKLWAAEIERREAKALEGTVEEYDAREVIAESRRLTRR